MLIDRLRKRITRNDGQAGFTLIELLVVIIIIGILLAIAIPSYLKFRDRANQSAAQANVRASIPAIEAYYADNNGTASDPDANASTTGYQGMTVSILQSVYDQGVKNISFGTLSTTSYCVQSTVGQAVYNKNGPGATISAGACP